MRSPLLFVGECGAVPNKMFAYNTAAPANLKKGCYSQRDCKGMWIRASNRQQCLSLAPNN